LKLASGDIGWWVAVVLKTSFYMDRILPKAGSFREGIVNFPSDAAA
jgi:hypothetical protein